MLKNIYRPITFEITKSEAHSTLLPCTFYKKNMGTLDEVPKNSDEFTKEFMRNRIKMTTFQKMLLSAGSSISALWDPRRYIS